MLWILIACTSDPKPPASDSGLPLPTTTPTAPPTSTEPDVTLPDGWSRIEIWHPDLVDVASDATDTWVVDSRGGLLRVGDPPWEELGDATFAEAPLIGPTHARDGTIWAASSEQLGVFDGASWATVPLPDDLWNPSAVVARRDGTVAVLTVVCSYTCDRSRVGIWDGSEWTLWHGEPSDPLVDLVETEGGALLAVGDEGRVALWDGAGWIDLHHEPSGSSLRAVAASGDQIVAVGDGGLVVRGTLGALTAASLGTDPLTGVDIADDGTVWALSAISAYVDDGAWTPVALPDEGRWTRIAATPDGALLVGSQGGPTVMRGGRSGWDVAWRRPSVTGVHDVWVDADGTAWFGAQQSIGRWDAAGFEAWDTPERDDTIEAVSGSGPDDVVTVGQSSLLAWDGADLRRVDEGEHWLFDVAVLPDGTAFVTARELAGDVPQLLRRDAGVWSVDPTPVPPRFGTLRAVVAFAADDVYALGWGELLRFDGASWTRVASLDGTYLTLWGRSGSDLYVANPTRSADPSLLHWDGASVTEVPGAPRDVRGVAGTATGLVVSSWYQGFEFAPSVWRWQDGAWDELLRATHGAAVGAAGETAVLTDHRFALRGPLSAW